MQKGELYPLPPTCFLHSELHHSLHLRFTGHVGGENECSLSSLLLELNTPLLEQLPGVWEVHHDNCGSLRCKGKGCGTTYVSSSSSYQYHLPCKPPLPPSFSSVFNLFSSFTFSSYSIFYFFFYNFSFSLSSSSVLTHLASK